MNRRRSLMGRDSLIPKEYKQVEYIRNVSSSSVDTGITFLDNNYSIEFKYNNVKTPSKNYGNMLFANWPSNLSTMVCFRYCYWDSYKRFGMTTNYDTKNKYSFADNYIGMDCCLKYGRLVAGSRFTTILTYDADTIPSDVTMKIFVLSDNNGNRLRCDVSYFRIKHNDDYICNMIPVIRKQDDVAGFYDIARKTFITKYAGDALVAGPELLKIGETREYTISDFMLESGNWSLNSATTSNYANICTVRKDIPIGATQITNISTDINYNLKVVLFDKVTQKVSNEISASSITFPYTIPKGVGAFALVFWDKPALGTVQNSNTSIIFKR